MSTDYFESAELSDVGRKRKNNEDACLRIPAHGVFCVADGMGGQAGGDLASEAIVTAVQEVFTKAGPGEDGTLEDRVALFTKGVNQASKWIKDFSDEKVIGQMGSTVVGLVIDPLSPARGMGLHAGDSRIYRYRGGVLQQLTTDHSAVAALAAKLGRDVASLPARYQNELLRAVGTTETVELENTPVEISSGDLFLICSDGLTRMIPDDGIAALLKNGAPGSIDAAVKALVSAANEAGGKDNVSVVLVRVGDISGAPKVEEVHQAEVITPELALFAPATEPADSGHHGSGDTPAMADTADMARGETPRTEDHTPSRETPSQTPSSQAPAKAEPRPVAPRSPRRKEPTINIRVGTKRRKPTTLGIVIIAAGIATLSATAWLMSGGTTKPAAPTVVHPAAKPPPPAITAAPAEPEPVASPAPTPTAAPMISFQDSFRAAMANAQHQPSSPKKQ
jgi:protein phosphatase